MSARRPPDALPGDLLSELERLEGRPAVKPVLPLDERLVLGEACALLGVSARTLERFLRPRLRPDGSSVPALLGPGERRGGRRTWTRGELLICAERRRQYDRIRPTGRGRLTRAQLAQGVVAATKSRRELNALAGLTREVVYAAGPVAVRAAFARFGVRLADPEVKRLRTRPSVVLRSRIPPGRRPELRAILEAELQTARAFEPT